LRIEEAIEARTEQQLARTQCAGLARGASDELVRIVLFGPIPSPDTALLLAKISSHVGSSCTGLAPNQDRPAAPAEAGSAKARARIAQSV